MKNEKESDISDYFMIDCVLVSTFQVPMFVCVRGCYDLLGFGEKKVNKEINSGHALQIFLALAFVASCLSCILI